MKPRLFLVRVTAKMSKAGEGPENLALNTKPSQRLGKICSWARKWTDDTKPTFGKQSLKSCLAVLLITGIEKAFPRRAEKPGSLFYVGILRNEIIAGDREGQIKIWTLLNLIGASL